MSYYSKQLEEKQAKLASEQAETAILEEKVKQKALKSQLLDEPETVNEAKMAKNHNNLKDENKDDEFDPCDWMLPFHPTEFDMRPPIKEEKGTDGIIELDDSSIESNYNINLPTIRHIKKKKYVAPSQDIIVLDDDSSIDSYKKSPKKKLREVIVLSDDESDEVGSSVRKTKGESKQTKPTASSLKDDLDDSSKNESNEREYNPNPLFHKSVEELVFNEDDEEETEDNEYDSDDSDFLCESVPDSFFEMKTRSIVNEESKQTKKSNMSTKKPDTERESPTNTTKSIKRTSKQMSTTQSSNRKVKRMKTQTNEDMKWHKNLEKASNIAKKKACTHRDQFMVLFDDDKNAEKLSTSSKVVLPSARNIVSILAVRRPDNHQSHFGSVDYHHHEHGSFEVKQFELAMKKLETTRQSLNVEPHNIVTYASEEDHEIRNEYANIQFIPQPEHHTTITKMKSSTNTFINSKFEELSTAAISNSKTDSDRGTLNPFTIGATNRVAQLCKYFKDYNCSNSTRPFLDKTHKFNKQSAKAILLLHVGLQVLNFSREQKAFNLSTVKEIANFNKKNSLQETREEWWKKFAKRNNSQKFTDEEGSKLNEIFWKTYKATRKSIRIELLSSLCPNLLNETIDDDFKTLLKAYVQSPYSDAKQDTNVEGITYRQAINIIASAVAEALAFRWSCDCGTHFDKQTCSLFNWTYFLSFKQYLHELPQSNDTLTTKLRESAAVDLETNEPYQFCMVAGYGRKIVNLYCQKIATQGMALESPYFSTLSKLIVTLLRRTQGTFLDYQYTFECEANLSKYYRKFKHRDDQMRMRMKGPMYKVPKVYSRIMWYSGFLHVLVSLILDGEVTTDKDIIKLCVYFSLYSNGTSNIFAAYNLWHAERSSYKGTFAENLLQLEETVQRITKDQTVSAGSCLHNRFRHSTCDDITIKNLENIVDTVTLHIRKIYKECKSAKSTKAMHKEYMELFSVLAQKIPTYNHFRGTILFQVLSLVQLYPIHFYDYASVNMNGATSGPVQMMKKQFEDQFSITFFKDSIPHNFRNPINELGVDVKKDIVGSDLDKNKMEPEIYRQEKRKKKFYNVTGIVLLKYIQSELDSLGIPISLNDLEDILCKIAKEYLPKKGNITIEDLRKFIEDPKNDLIRTQEINPIYFDNHCNKSMNLFRVRDTKAKGRKLFLRNFNQPGITPCVIKWTLEPSKEHLIASFENTTKVQEHFISH